MADIEKMGIYRKPLADFCPYSKASVSYKALWKEIEKKLPNIRNQKFVINYCAL
jgi:hypothetical protein